MCNITLIILDLPSKKTPMTTTNRRPSRLQRNVGRKRYRFSITYNGFFRSPKRIFSLSLFSPTIDAPTFSLGFSGFIRAFFNNLLFRSLLFPIPHSLFRPYELSIRIPAIGSSRLPYTTSITRIRPFPHSGHFSTYSSSSSSPLIPICRRASSNFPFLARLLNNP